MHESGTQSSRQAAAKSRLVERDRRHCPYSAAATRMLVDAREEFAMVCAAVREGDVAKLKSVYRGVDVNQPLATWDSRTPLHFAVVNANYDMVQHLLTSCGGNPAAVDDKGRNALHHAILENSERIIGLLIEHGGIDYRATDIWDQNALHLVAIADNVSLAETIVKACPECLTAREADGRTPLDIAEMNNHLKMAALLKRWADQGEPTGGPRQRRRPSGPAGDAVLSQTATAAPSMKKKLMIPSPASSVSSQETDSPTPSHERVKSIVATLESRRPSNVDGKPPSDLSECDHGALRDAWQSFLTQSNQTRATLERQLDGIDLNDSKVAAWTAPIDNGVAQLDEGRNLTDNDVDALLNAVDDAWGIDAVLADAADLKRDHPDYDEVVALHAQIADLAGLVRSGAYPAGTVDVTAPRDAIALLRDLCGSDQRHRLGDALRSNAELSAACRRLDTRLEALKASGDHAGIPVAEDELFQAYDVALSASRDLLESCGPTDQDKIVQERIDKIRTAGVQIMGRVSMALRQGRDRVRQTLGVMERNTAAANDVISGVVSALQKRKAELKAARDEDQRARQRIAEQLQAIIAEELDRQVKFIDIVAEERRVDQAMGKVERGSQDLLVVRDVKVDKLRTLNDTYDQAMKVVDCVHKVGTFGIDASQALWAKRRMHQDAVRHDEAQNSARLYDRFVRNLRDSIDREEVQLRDIDEEIRQSVAFQQRAGRHGRLQYQTSLDSVVNALRDEQQRVTERRDRLRSVLDRVDALGADALDASDVVRTQLANLDMSALQSQSSDSPTGSPRIC